MDIYHITMVTLTGDWRGVALGQHGPNGRSGLLQQDDIAVIAEDKIQVSHIITAPSLPADDQDCYSLLAGSILPHRFDPCKLEELSGSWCLQDQIGHPILGNILRSHVIFIYALPR